MEGRVGRGMMALQEEEGDGRARCGVWASQEEEGEGSDSIREDKKQVDGA